MTCRKSFCAACAILLRRFQNMRCIIPGRPSTLDVASSIFRRRRSISTCRLACFLPIALAGLRQVVTKCKLRGRRGISLDMMKFGRSLARNIDFEVATFRLLLKTSRKREFLTYNLSKLREFDCTYFDFHSTNLYISDCFDLCVVNMRMSIRVRGLHLVCFQLADTLWHESPASNLAQVNA